eukprot:CAMPEP_0172533122 /NCGR_PEP_ID=MMETSP1067-20121228/5930_1 /TAXON_ID=265564 ORGANISM="Thalassiosira punctigera, Strain Tpunct2005C2" /NCGR_SAMPLE_ID=MMETSP1067 /ASSEMBLY_ACC=CAM_ASM_000444 /LENGTH=365 /DNA_ID=CAMNT_0013317713 /DNA_START=49 /DNA_END=1146 /DNA_ORIENTATION=-
MDEKTNGMKGKSTEPSGDEARGSKAGRNDKVVTSAADSVSIANAAAHLHRLLQAKEEELKVRESDFERRVNLFETENPSMGNDTDVIQLNVGGSANVAVLRRTLTLFEDSVLAAKFSGRWDDSLEKDRDGNIFVDQDPEHFLCLLSFLRLKMNNRTRQVPDRHVPKPSYSFCSMLEYYNLMPGVYPQSWLSQSNEYTCEETSYGTVVLSTKETGNAATVLHCFDAFVNAGVSEFTASFEKGATGAVGWLDVLDIGKASEYSATPVTAMENSIYVNIAERKIFGSDSILEENLKIDHMESSSDITCRYDGKSEYSVELVGISPSGGVASTLQKTRYYSRDDYRVFPMIAFSGKVTVSSLKYAIDNL